MSHTIWSFLSNFHLLNVFQLFFTPFFCLQNQITVKFSGAQEIPTFQNLFFICIRHHVISYQALPILACHVILEHDTLAIILHYLIYSIISFWLCNTDLLHVVYFNFILFKQQLLFHCHASCQMCLIARNLGHIILKKSYLIIFQLE